MPEEFGVWHFVPASCLHKLMSSGLQGGLQQEFQGVHVFKKISRGEGDISSGVESNT